MSTIPRNCNVCGCLFDVPSAKISIEHCIVKELNATAFLCVKCASKLIKWLQDNSNDPHLISEVNSNIEKTEELGNKNYSTVNIDGTTWMAENLAYDDGCDGIYYNPRNKEYYYTWEAANRVAKKFGWKLPTNEDWDKACEECDGVKNEFNDYIKCSLKHKLNIKHAGSYSYCGSIYCSSYFWSASEHSSNHAWFSNLDDDSSVTRNVFSKTNGCLIRLIKDKE